MFVDTFDKYFPTDSLRSTIGFCFLWAIPPPKAFRFFCDVSKIKEQSILAQFSLNSITQFFPLLLELDFSN